MDYPPGAIDDEKVRLPQGYQFRGKKICIHPGGVGDAPPDLDFAGVEETVFVEVLQSQDSSSGGAAIGDVEGFDSRVG